MMRVTDYIAKFIHEQLLVDQLFMVSGGGMMFLSDGVAQCSGLKVVCSHHEQAAAMGAVGYAKYKNAFGVAMVTTGCGGTNAVTGLLNAWQDSARVLFVSGQCKRKQTVRNSNLKLRQFGVQEADIISVVESLTKYAVMVNEPNDIAYELEKAAWMATSGRPGPVWIDVPMDVQGTSIEVEALHHFTPPLMVEPTGVKKEDLEYLASALKTSKRPVVLAGQGVDLAGQDKAFADWIHKLNLPVVTSFLGGNVSAWVPENYIGRIGTKGTRAGNLAVQNADFLLVLGCRLSVSSTGHEYEMFARSARKMIVDIDPIEHEKNTVSIDRLVIADLRDFFRQVQSTPLDAAELSWLQNCQAWKNRYPIIPANCFQHQGGISLYCFMQAVNSVIAGNPDVAVVSDAGSSFYVTSQAVEVGMNQRYITSGGQAEMGFSLPAAIGAAAAGSTRVVAITGDGSLQMNIQELQTLRHYQFPVKLFVWNNNGYLSIRATQRKFFNGRFIGTDAASGVSFPDLQKIADAYGIRYRKISMASDLNKGVSEVFAGDDPVVCEVMCDPNEEIIPSISSVRLADGSMKSLPPEDMYPFLEWDELVREMKITPISRS